MKPILLFGLAALSALAVGGAASAQPAGMSTQVTGAARPSFGNYGDVGRPFVFFQGDRQRGGRGFGRGFSDGVGGWGNGVYEDPESLRDAGFFAGSASAYSDGNRVHYEYDRGYPYDWYRENSGRSAGPTAGRGGSANRVSCSVEGSGVRVCRGGR